MNECEAEEEVDNMKKYIRKRSATLKD